MKIETVIVRMPNWIGDFVMATPVLEDLRRFYPDAHITVMCQAPFGDLLLSNPHVDEIFSFTKREGIGRRLYQRHIVEKLKRGQYDLGILLTNSFSSAFWFWLGNVRYRLGFGGHFRKWLLSSALTFPEERKRQHLVLTYKSLLKPLGIPVSSTPPCLFVKEEEREAARKGLERYGIKAGAKIIGINPGAAYGSAKCWLPERFKELTERLIASDENIYCVYFGDKGTSSLVNGICEGLSLRVVNLAERTSLKELISLISLCDVFITNDSGPMHIADALGVNVIALFGSTNPLVTGPYRKGVVIQHSVPCSPCHKRVCPIDFPCMKSITVDEVYKTTLKELR